MSENTLNINSKIIKRLPYAKEFLFVDEIEYIDEKKVIGHYTFRQDSFYYNAHFKDNPATPGVLLIETMGQIGGVCHLIYLEKLYITNKPFKPVLSNLECSFHKPVKADDKLTVISNKIYLRNGVLKSDIQLLDSESEICAMCQVQIKLIY